MVIDLRSDTVTLPSPKMMEAIQQAELGDDVYGEDETVNKLEETAARMLGKEAGLLVTSGTQGNLVSLLSHTTPGEEIILEAQSHIVYYEVGSLARLGGLMARTIPTTDGFLSPEQIRAAVRVKNIHMPVTSLLAFENTHNRLGGAVLTVEQSRAMSDAAREFDLKVHIDGARIFNASVALEVDPSKLADPGDSLTFCLSKGLAAPIGSVVVGTEEFIEKARKYRKMLGGGMRQAGIIAAPGLVALNQMVDRLAEDHDHAQLIAKKLETIEGVIVRPTQTNIVVFDVSGTGLNATEVLKRLEQEGILGIDFSSTLVRLTTHYGITREHVDLVLEAIDKVFAK